jgi:hypothetical protein
MLVSENVLFESHPVVFYNINSLFD